MTREELYKVVGAHPNAEQLLDAVVDCVVEEALEKINGMFEAGAEEVLEKIKGDSEEEKCIGDYDPCENCMEDL